MSLVFVRLRYYADLQKEGKTVVIDLEEVPFDKSYTPLIQNLISRFSSVQLRFKNIGVGWGRIIPADRVHPPLDTVTICRCCQCEKRDV